MAAYDTSSGRAGQGVEKRSERWKNKAHKGKKAEFTFGKRAF